MQAKQAPDFFFVSFYSASCLCLGDLVPVQRCLGQPADLPAPCDLQRLWYLAYGRLVFIFNLSNAESRGTWTGWRTFAWMNWLSCSDTDFLKKKCLRVGEDSERGETKFAAGVTVTAPTTMHAEERRRECSQKCEQEDRAAVRLRAYRTVQTRPVSTRSVHHGIFPDVYFFFIPSPFSRRMNGTQWREGESKFLPCFS